MGNKPKILIVDDREENLIITERMLADINAEFVRASSGEEALAAVQTDEFALCLMDIQMPGMDGFETLERMRQNKRLEFLPVIFVSSVYKEEHYLVKGVETGAVDFITKSLMQTVLKGKVRMFLALYSQKKELQEKNIDLQKLDQLKSDFVSTVSHELRTPLTTIRESISQVLEGLLGEMTKDQKEFLSIAFADVNRLKRIIDDLLDISKIEAGKTELKRELVDVVALVKRASSSFRSQAKEKGLEIKENYSQESMEVYVDADKIIQVFTNLIGNAFKFTNQGYIEISVIEKEGQLECAVSDTGIGIAQENLPKAFGKFQQFGRTAGPGEKGTGLGLAISKGIVDLHKGKIWIESKSGEGTRFIFMLPKQNKEQLMLENIEERIAEAKREDEGLSVAVISLDNYQEIESELGKEAAQKITSKLLEVKNALRGEDSVFAVSPGEIVVVAKTNKQGESLQIKNRLTEVIKESISGLDQKSIAGFSYGYSNFPQDGDSAKALLENAHSNMLEEKQQKFNKNIMIVDDEPTAVESLAKILKALGYRNVTEVYGGEEALGKLEEDQFDLLMIDMKMPKMNGYELVGRLKEGVDTKDIPILIMSGYVVDIDKIEEYSKRKFIPTVSKPFDIDQLKRAVNYLL